MNILEAKNIVKTVKVAENDTDILKGVSLSIGEGEFVSVMGPSGSGKSTLLYNISGMDKATSGTVILNGKEITLLPEDELSKIRLEHMGFVFQDINLLKNLSIEDNIMFPAMVLQKENRDTIKKKSDDLTEETGIGPIRKSSVGKVSGGQMQRAGICRALINNPVIIFADEPTGSLDSKSSKEILSLFGEINRKGTTIMVVTHDINVAMKSDRVLFMKDGEIVDEKVLGRYDVRIDNDAERETELSRFLRANGF